MTDSDTLTPEVQAESASPTIDDVVFAMLTAEGTLAAVADAILADSGAFTVSAVTTFAAISSGVTASAIAAAAKVAKVGYSSASAVLRHSRTGEILSLGGSLDEGFNPRDVQSCYDKSTKLNGVRVTISVTPRQHAVIVVKATDVMDAYKMLVKATRENLAALTAVAENEAENEATDKVGDEAENEVSVTESLAAALAALTAVIGADLTDDDVATLNEIQDALNMIADSVDESAEVVAA